MQSLIKQKKKKINKCIDYHIYAWWLVQLPLIPYMHSWVHTKKLSTTSYYHLSIDKKILSKTFFHSLSSLPHTTIVQPLPLPWHRSQLESRTLAGTPSHISHVSQPYVNTRNKILDRRFASISFLISLPFNGLPCSPNYLPLTILSCSISPRFPFILFT